jgi:hypothetical protein
VRKKKRSLGRDVFSDIPDGDRSGALKRLIEGGTPAKRAAPREVELKIKLNPHNIKHLDEIRAKLEKAGKGTFTRSELIRVAIALLAAEDL